MPSGPRSIPDRSKGAAPRVCGWTAVAMARTVLLQAESDTVLARVAAADQRLAVDEGRLAAAELRDLVLDADLEARGGEVGGVEPGLDQQRVAVDAEARVVEG